MRLVFDKKALSDIAHIFDWISVDRPAAAPMVVRRLYRSIEFLILFPELGKEGLDPGTREWLIKGLPYRVVYEIDDAAGEVQILAVYHHAQDRPGRPD